MGGVIALLYSSFIGFVQDYVMNDVLHLKNIDRYMRANDAFSATHTQMLHCVCIMKHLWLFF